MYAMEEKYHKFKNFCHYISLDVRSISRSVCHSVPSLSAASRSKTELYLITIAVQLTHGPQVFK